MKFRSVPAFLVDRYADVVGRADNGPLNPYAPVIVREPDSIPGVIANLHAAGLTVDIITYDKEDS